MAAGELVIVADDEDRENEGDLIMAAERATPEKLAFMIRHTSGIICQPMTGDRLDQLDLPQMVEQNTESKRTAFTVSVDAREGTTTGVSAEDRARTELGTWTYHLYRSSLYPGEHLALVMGEIDPEQPVLTRVHRACLAGDVFQSKVCTCGAKLRASLRRITAEKNGVLVYLRGPESHAFGRHEATEAREEPETGRVWRDAGLGAQLVQDVGV